MRVSNRIIPPSDVLLLGFVHGMSVAFSNGKFNFCDFWCVTVCPAHRSMEAIAAAPPPLPQQEAKRFGSLGSADELLS